MRDDRSGDLQSSTAEASAWSGLTVPGPRNQTGGGVIIAGATGPGSLRSVRAASLRREEVGRRWVDVSTAATAPASDPENEQEAA